MQFTCGGGTNTAPLDGRRSAENVQSKLKKALPARTISMLHPDANMIQFGRSESFLNGLKLAVDLWHVKFKVTASGMHRARWVEDQAGIEQVRRSLESRVLS